MQVLAKMTYREPPNTAFEFSASFAKPKAGRSEYPLYALQFFTRQLQLLYYFCRRWAIRFSQLNPFER